MVLQKPAASLLDDPYLDRSLFGTASSDAYSEAETDAGADHIYDRSSLIKLIYVLNGPNLNLLGKRQPHIFGHEKPADIEPNCRALAEN